jgi:hypothetical protein
LPALVAWYKNALDCLPKESKVCLLVSLTPC